MKKVSKHDKRDKFPTLFISFSTARHQSRDIYSARIEILPYWTVFNSEREAADFASSIIAELRKHFHFSNLDD